MVVFFFHVNDWNVSQVYFWRLFGDFLKGISWNMESQNRLIMGSYMYNWYAQTNCLNDFSAQITVSAYSRLCHFRHQGGLIVWTYAIDSASVPVTDLDDVLIRWNPHHSTGYATIACTPELSVNTPAVYSLQVNISVSNCCQIYIYIKIAYMQLKIIRPLF